MAETTPLGAAIIMGNVPPRCRWVRRGGGRKLRVSVLVHSGCFDISQGPTQYLEVIGTPTTQQFDHHSHLRPVMFTAVP